MSTELDPRSQLSFEKLAAPAGGVPLAAAVTPKIERNWGTEIIGAVDDDAWLLDLTRQFIEKKKPAGLHILDQTNQNSTEIAQFMLARGVTSLITDNNMKKGALGLEVIREMIGLGGDRAKNIAFVLFSGEARQDEVAKVNLELAAKGCKQIVLLSKPCGAEPIFEAIERSWGS